VKLRLGAETQSHFYAGPIILAEKNGTTSSGDFPVQNIFGKLQNLLIDIIANKGLLPEVYMTNS